MKIGVQGGNLIGQRVHDWDFLLAYFHPQSIPEFLPHLCASTLSCLRKKCLAHTTSAENEINEKSTLANGNDRCAGIPFACVSKVRNGDSVESVLNRELTSFEVDSQSGNR